MEILSRMAWGLVGAACLIAVAWTLSSDRRRFPWRVVGWGVGLQALFAWGILTTPPGRWFFERVRDAVAGLLGFTDHGARFLFGKLYEGSMVYDPAVGTQVPLGFIFIAHVLMTIVFFGALMSVLYHIGLMQLLIGAVARVMRLALGTSGSETLCCAANIFVGQTEAPLVVKPYIDRMTRSEMMAVMTGGFATIAGGVMIAYTRMGMDAGHLLAASVMSAPAALVFAKVMIPETEVSETAGTAPVKLERTTLNVIDAAAVGAGDGMKLAINVAAMLMAFLALIAMLDAGLGWVGGLVGRPGLSMASIFGIVFGPFALMMGIPWDEAPRVGQILGTQVSVNEMVAYARLVEMRETLSPRSFDIATYALCGFANFGSVAIQLGGISALAPGRRADLAKLGLRAMLAGAFACWQTATIAGIFIDPADSAARRAESAREADWVKRRLNYQEQIDAYEKQISDYPQTELAAQARTRIAALRAEAYETFVKMDAVAMRLYWKEARHEEAMAIYRKVVDEFTTAERFEAFEAETGAAVPLEASDPEAAHPLLKRWFEKYARSGHPEEARLEDLDKSNRTQANRLRLSLLESYALETHWRRADGYVKAGRPRDPPR